MKTKKDVYAIFDSEIYTVYYMNGILTGLTSMDYIDLCYKCRDRGFELVRVDGLDD